MHSYSPWHLTFDTALIALALLAGCRGAPDGAAAPGTGGEDTTVYMTEAEALRVVFPSAARVVKETFTLDAAGRRSVESVLRGRLDASSFTVHAGVSADGRLDGYALILWEIGKFKPFHFIVGIEPDGRVRRVAVLVYRESRGGEVVRRRFLHQYEGKSAKDPIRTSRDIINISGATMSVTSLNLGVRKALAVVQATYLQSPERARALVERGQEVEVPPLRSPGVTGRSSVAETEVREARYVMGALCEIRAWGRDQDGVRGAIARAFLEIEEADRVLSDYREDSELSALNRSAGGGARPISEVLADFLGEAARISRASGGSFDITVGPIMAAWGFRGSREEEPSPAELDALRPLVDASRVSLERGPLGATCRLELAGMRLDPGGLGKGFAVDRAAGRLRREGIRAALIDFSGNMLALGAPPGSDAWTVAIRDPAHPDLVLGTIRLRDRAVSSSGSYEKFTTLGGVPRGHILSPRTLAPVEGVHGAVAVAGTAAAADGWSTAAHVLGAEAIEYLERNGVEGLVSLESGTCVETRGWGALLEPWSAEVCLR